MKRMHENEVKYMEEIPEQVQDRINYHCEALNVSNEKAPEYNMDNVSFENVMNRHNKTR